ncbi:MAG: hypothetical protein JW873_02095 [Candidatus Saganbacteria bacterium]|nr:hypothetical protein [Candidatus Saganbacteria bacterium]
MTQYMIQFVALLVVLVIWTLTWKGIALWRSARNNQLPWFVVLLFINILGLLEIIYLAFFQRDKNKSK